jgi:hypothetical protein
VRIIVGYVLAEQLFALQKAAAKDPAADIVDGESAAV